MNRLLRNLIRFILPLAALEAMARYRDWGLPPATPHPPLRGVVAHASAVAPTVVVLGDSIPWGYGLSTPQDAWPARLGHRLADEGTPWRVVDVSIPGETTLQGWARWRRDVRPWKPRRVLIAFGINDCHLKRTAADVWRWQHFPRGWGRRVRLIHLIRVLTLPAPQNDHPDLAPRLSAEQTAEVLEAMVQQARREDIEAWVLTPTPVGSSFHSEWPEAVRLYQHDMCLRTVSAIRETARRYNIPLVDVHAAMQPLDPAWFQEDGVHLTVAGQARVADIVATAWRREGGHPSRKE